MRCEQKRRAETRMMTSFERFVNERKSLVLNSLIYCKRVKRLESRSDIMTFWRSSDSRIERNLKTVNLSRPSCKIKQKRVAIVDF